MDEQEFRRLDMTASDYAGKEEADAAPLSITDKFVGIFSEPAAVFANVRLTGPRYTDWLMPLLALVTIVATATMIKFSNPEFLADMRDMQVAAMKEQVESGKMTEEQAEHAMEQMDSFAGLQKIGAVVMSFFSIPIVFLMMTLFYWLLSRYLLGGDATYGMVLAVLGLTAWIGVLEQLVTLLLGLLTGNHYATPSPTLLMKVDLGSQAYRLANSLNPFSIWSTFLFGLGLHKTASLSKPRAFGLVFGLWILWVVGSSFMRIPGMS